MATLDAVAGATIECHDLVLARRERIAVQRDDLPGDRRRRGMGGVVGEFARRERRQPVADVFRGCW